MTLEDFGLNAKLLVAGFAGGAVHAVVFKQTSAWAAVGSVLCGTLTANFLAPVASHYIGNWIDPGPCGFIVGLTAMAMCQGVVGVVNTKLKGLGGRERAKETRP